MNQNNFDSVLYKKFNEYNFDRYNVKNVGEFLITLKIYNPDAHFKYCTIIDFIKKI